jgi:hypothetical protein
MSDRLQELLHQRAAIQAHLAWLDREIAQARSSANPATDAPPAPLSPLPAVATSSSVVGTSLTAVPALTADPDTLLASYKQDSQNLRTDVRKGCLLYFFGAFFLLGLGIAAFYFVNRLIRQQSAPVPSEQRAAPVQER